MTQRIVFFGGTFDPPHQGHVQLIEQIIQKYDIDLVLWTPSYIPPHKSKNISLYEHRFEMSKLATQLISNVHVSDIEFRLFSHQPSYSIITLQTLKKKYPDDQIILLIGGDSLLQLHSWYASAELLDFPKIIFPRPDFEISLSKLQQFWKPQEAEKLIRCVDFSLPLFTESSTDIRHFIQSHPNALSCPGLSQVVFDYISCNGLYQSCINEKQENSF